MTRFDLDWRVLGPTARPGAAQMARDEVAAETAGAGGPATVRVYRWAPSTLSLGYAQDPATVDWAACEDAGIDTVRRPTGGGAIFHDRHTEVSYAVVVPASAVPGDLMDSYEVLCAPILDALERMGVDAAFADEERPAVHDPACFLRALHPAHDVVGPDGRKVSGNAQYRQRDAVVQHGSLSLSLTPERHCRAFAADLDPGTFRERVGAVDEYADTTPTEAVQTLLATLAEWAGVPGAVANGEGTGAWTDAEDALAADLIDEKFGTEAWTRDRETAAR